jgi:flagellar biosynthesis chaperone FliJ
MQEFTELSIGERIQITRNVIRGEEEKLQALLLQLMANQHLARETTDPKQKAGAAQAVGATQKQIRTINLTLPPMRVELARLENLVEEERRDEDAASTPIAGRGDADLHD